MSLFRLINKDVLLAGAAVILVTACCFHELVLHPGDLLVGCQRNGLNDVTAYMLASRSFPAVAQSQFGQLPLWNPFVLAGTPFTGNPQSALFYLPNSIFLVLRPAVTISWMLVLHHLWAGFGTLLLSRGYGLSIIGSVAAGAIFLGAPFLVAQTGEGHYNQICAVSWIPWAFLAWERLKQQRRASVVAMAIVMAMCFFCGHAQEVYYLGLILTLLTLAEVVRLAGAERKDEARMLVQRWLLAGIGAVGLIAVDLLPAWHYTRLTIRSGHLDVEEAAGLRLANLSQLLDPFILGHPAQSASVQSTDFYWETVCHFGLVPLLLAVIGMTLGLRLRRRPGRECPDDEQQEPVNQGCLSPCRQRTRVTIQFTVLWIFSLVFAFGAGSPIFEAFHRFVPGVAMFRIPSRMLFFTSFAVAMLAGIGVDALAERRVRIRKNLTPGIGSGLFSLCSRTRESSDRSLTTSATQGVESPYLLPGILVGLTLLTACLLLAALFRDAPLDLPPVSVEPAISAFTLSPQTWSVPGNWTTWAWLTGGLSLICFASLSRKGQPQVLWAVIALAVLELSFHAHHVLRTAPPDSLRSDGQLADVFGPNEGRSRTLVQQEVLSDREAVELSIWKVQGYEPVCLSPYVAAFRSALPETPNFSEGLFGFAPIRLNEFSKPVIDMLGVRWAIVTTDEQEVPAGWKLLSSGSQPPLLTLRDGNPEAMNYQVYENTTELPRAMVVGQATTVRAGEDGTAALARCNFREEVLLLKDILAEGPRAEPRAASIERYTANEVVINVDATAPGYLVLSDSWSPGWTASVDDLPTEVLRANVAFRAVPVPAGNHTVRFRFWPPGLSEGATISLLTLGLLCYLSFGRK